MQQVLGKKREIKEEKRGGSTWESPMRGWPGEAQNLASGESIAINKCGKPQMQGEVVGFLHIAVVLFMYWDLTLLCFANTKQPRRCGKDLIIQIKECIIDMHGCKARYKVAY